MRNWMLRVALRASRIGLPALLLCAALSTASAQWAWRDENGRPVYSDQPPPASVKAADILQQPTAAPQNQTESPDAAPQGQSAAPAPAAAPKAPTMAEREQEFRKRMKERAEAEKKLADAQAQATQKASDCERARGYAKSLDDGVRLIRTNPDGSREMMDQEQRAAEAKRTRDFLDSNCN